MHSVEIFGYMSIIETLSDVDNTFLSRRELTCNFAGLAGKLKKLEAVDMITKEFKLDGKLVIPINLSTHVGKPTVTGTFFVYEDEKLAKAHVNPVVFSRLDKAKKKNEPPEAEAAAEQESSEASPETKEAKAEDKPKEEAKSE